MRKCRRKACKAYFQPGCQSLKFKISIEASDGDFLAAEGHADADDFPDSRLLHLLRIAFFFNLILCFERSEKREDLKSQGFWYIIILKYIISKL